MSCLHCLRLLCGVGLLLAAPLIASAQSIMISGQGGVPPGCCLGTNINQGDFNNDGIPDIVIGNFNGVTVYLGRGDGTFAPPFGIGVDATGADFAIGDFNGDGNLDVAYTSFLGQVCVALGNGDGSFRRGDCITTTGGPASIAAADFNLDGKLDLAVGIGLNSSGTVAAGIEILQGDGTGHFSPANTFPLNNSASLLTRVRVGDFNNDGKVDLAVLQMQVVSVFFGNGDFTFDEVVLNQYAQTTDITTVDVNQDGFTDILVSFGRFPVDLEAKKGGVDGYFGQPSRSLGFRHLVDPSNAFASPGGLTAADVDGDGINDIVAMNYDTTGRGAVFGLFVWKGNPDGTFQQTPARFLYSGAAGGFDLVAGDFNRDGKIDFASADPILNTLEVFLNASPPSPCMKRTISGTITICQPQEDTFSHSPLHVVAQSTSADTVTGLNLYVDNALLGQFSTSSIDQLLSLPNGNHFVVVKGFDSTGASFRSNRHVTIFDSTPGETCPTSSQGLSVHICVPEQNAIVTSSVQVLANAYSPRIITAIQVYIDGRLELDDSTTTWVNKPFPLGPGMHFLVVKAFDGDGHQITDTRTIRVK